MTQRHHPIPVRDGWLVPVGDGRAEVTSEEFSLLISVGGCTCIRLESTLAITANGATTSFEPESADAAAGLLQLGQRVEQIIVWSSGALTIDFGAGGRVEVAPDQHYEAFQVYEIGSLADAWPAADSGLTIRWDDAHEGSIRGHSLTDRFEFISVPGGGVSSFTSRAKPPAT